MKSRRARALSSLSEIQMKPRLLLVSALASTVFMTGLPPAARAADARLLEANRFMTVSASSSAYTDIHIPQGARLSLNYWTRKDVPTPRFSQGPGFVALVLASREAIGVTYSAVRLPAEKGVFQRHISLAPDFCQLDRFCKIPAGSYRLFLVTDVPASVEVEFKGLRGSSNVELKRQMTGDISGATESYFHSTPQGPVEVDAHGAGFSPTLSGRANFIFSAFWFRGSNEPAGPAPADKPLLQAGATGECFFGGSPLAPEAYAPGCPTGEPGSNHTTTRALSDFGSLQWGSAGNIRPGPYGVGYYAVHTGIRNAGFVGFWLDLDG
jgi:hypothetical protein